jgi:hypothetical protein
LTVKKLAVLVRTIEVNGPAEIGIKLVFMKGIIPGNFFGSFF